MSTTNNRIWHELSKWRGNVEVNISWKVFVHTVCLSLTNQPICQPKKFQAKDAIPMSDDDYLLAELNGHFE